MSVVRVIMLITWIHYVVILLITWIHYVVILLITWIHYGSTSCFHFCSDKKKSVGCGKPNARDLFLSASSEICIKKTFLSPTHTHTLSYIQHLNKDDDESYCIHLAWFLRIRDNYIHMSDLSGFLLCDSVLMI